MQWLIDLVKEWIEAQGYLLTSFVDRGDPASVDYLKTDFIRDNGWHELDLSSIVPAGAKAVALSTVIFDTAVSSQLSFRTAGNNFALNIAASITQVANVFIWNELIVAVDSDRKIEYRATAVGWIIIQVTVKGWWL